MKFFNIRIGLLKHAFSVYFENAHYYFYQARLPNDYNVFNGPLINGNCYAIIKRAYSSCYGRIHKDYDLSRKENKDCYEVVYEIPQMFKRNRTARYVCSYMTQLSPLALEATIEAFFKLDKYLETKAQEELKDRFEPISNAGIEIYFIGTSSDESRFNTKVPRSKFIKHKILMNEYNEDLIKSVCTFVS